MSNITINEIEYEMINTVANDMSSTNILKTIVEEGETSVNTYRLNLPPYNPETLAPFLDQFDFDPENCVFLGKPIDYISFDDDAVTLIEVKSGKSQLNARQRHIRDLVKSNQVNWKEIRIK